MRQIKNGFSKKVTYISLVIFSILCLYPLLWLLMSSFKDGSELFTNTWGIPKSLHIENYTRAISKGNIGNSFLNSFIITGVSVFLSVILGAMVSYGIERLNWKMSVKVKSLFLMGMSIPTYAAIVPLFAMFNKLQLLDSYIAVIIAHVVFALPMTVFILAGFFSTIPKELEEAAIMDGCSVIQSFFKIILPVAKSSVVTVAVINFINIWNDLLFAQVFLTAENKMPLPVALTTFADLDSVDYTGLLAAVVLSVIPTIVIYIILHDQIMDGMTSGAVKG
ncbi:carbohydrate ABC transporter permease [Enterococcus aquimarinus]|nr:carbohydrate ABC transporter permease [Enterococcus aquimarinus]